MEPEISVQSDCGGGGGGSDAVSGFKFIEFNKRSNSKTTIWTHFLREEKGNYAKCKVQNCNKILKTSGTTTTLHRHLKTIHSITLAENEEIETETVPVPKKKVKPIDMYFQPEEKSLELTLSRMTACDGLSFAVFTTSIDLRALIAKMGYNEKMPNSRTIIRKKVVDYSNKVRNDQIKTIQNLKEKGERFSLVFDEWTSSRNRRYMNIILKSQTSTFWDIGLVRIFGSFTAEAGLELIENKLISYGLSLKNDTVAIITDGVSVMKKLGRLAPCGQQLCLAHGIQLAVIDTLYPKKKKLNDADINEGTEDADEIEVLIDNEGAEVEDLDGNFDIMTENTIEVEVTHEHFGPLIKKVRHIVKMFKKSPLKNEYLQRHIFGEFKKEYQLILDSKTRWNSLVDMVERFLLVKNCILKALKDVESSTTFEDYEFSSLKCIFEALNPVKLTVEALCRRDANLLTADAALGCLFSTLLAQNSPISLELYSTLETRIKERRNDDMSSLIFYLHSGKKIINAENDIFPALSNNKIISTVKDYLMRLKSESELRLDDSDTRSDQNVENDNGSIFALASTSATVQESSFQNELEIALKNINTQAHVEKSQSEKTLISTIKSEVALFNNGGARGYHLQLVYEYLKSISPTSVESERAFSSAGYICTKIRSKLNDDTLETLCFLRSYFRKLKSDM